MKKQKNKYLIKNIPFFERDILLSEATKKSKEFLLTYPGHRLKKEEKRKFQKYLSRRFQGEPIAYLIQKKEFFNLNFYINKNALIPRPDTEILVEEALKSIKRKDAVICDIGTGSGCIIISLARQIKKGEFYAVDLKKKILNLARKNAEENKVKIRFLKGNLLKPLSKILLKTKKNIFIIANLPYLTTKQYLKTQFEIKKYEPRYALDGGKNGLKYFQKLFKQLKKINLKARLFLEIDPRQKKKIKEIIKKYFPQSRVIIKKDLNGLDRVINFKT